MLIRNLVNRLRERQRSNYKMLIPIGLHLIHSALNLTFLCLRHPQVLKTLSFRVVRPFTFIFLDWMDIF